MRYMDGEVSYGVQGVRGLWHIARVPIVMVMVILEPLVAFACSALALLGVLATLFFWLVAAPHFAAWTMLAISLAFAGALVLYELLIRLLSD
jgi:hypothetical protein